VMTKRRATTHCIQLLPSPLQEEGSVLPRFPRLSRGLPPVGHLCSLPYPILRRLSRPRAGAPTLAPMCSGGALPRRQHKSASSLSYPPVDSHTSSALPATANGTPKGSSSAKRRSLSFMIRLYTSSSACVSPQAPCPRHASHGTPGDLTLPPPAARVQPQCSKRGAHASPAAGARWGYCRAVRGARAQPQSRRGCWRVPAPHAFDFVTLSAN
jgi:hypothetical protein